MADGGCCDERQRHPDLNELAPGHTRDANKAYLGRGIRPPQAYLGRGMRPP
jgi:hypothetical protein